MLNVKWAYLWHDNAYIAPSNFDAINASHNTLVLANPRHALNTSLQPWNSAKTPSSPLST
jgi:hypothetical protein